MISIQKLKFIGLAYIVWVSFCSFMNLEGGEKKPISLKMDPRISLGKKVYFI